MLYRSPEAIGRRRLTTYQDSTKGSGASKDRGRIEAGGLKRMMSINCRRPVHKRFNKTEEIQSVPCLVLLSLVSALGSSRRAEVEIEHCPER
jgi:hypothetical protein